MGLRFQIPEPVVWTLAAVLTALAWTTHLASKYFVRRLGSERAASTAPYMLTGSRMNLSRQVVPLGSTSPPTQPSQVLLLFYNEQCSVCKEQIPDWQDLLSRLRPSSRGEVWLITVNSTDGVSSTLWIASTRGLRVRIFRAPHSDALGIATGLNGTPITAVIDQAGDIRASVLGLSHKANTLILAAWDELAEQSLDHDVR